MKVYDKLFIGGKWVVPSGSGSIDVIHAGNETIVGQIPDGCVSDAESAVHAARNAFDGWFATPPGLRAKYIRSIADGLKARNKELAQLIACEVGMPIKLARTIQVDGPIQNWLQTARLAEEISFEEKVGNSIVLREPVGVVAAITPWNYPLYQITLKLASALAAGCTVVLKPSEVAPLNAFVLAEIIEAAGLPPGVFNLVAGYGGIVGEALAGHSDVDMVSFTGSTRAGKRVAELAAQSVKRVALELGGKSASIILDDADLVAAVKGTVSSCLLNSGQTCSAQTRMLVPRARYGEAKAIARKIAEGFVVGDPLQDSSRLGPLVSAAQKTRVIDYIKRGIREGAELVAGGPEDPEGLEKGFFVKPTILGVADPATCIAQEEIFGPVLTIICYDTEDDAIHIANNSIYGLGGGVWSRDEAHAIEVARRIRTGQVDINGGRFNPQAPFGGYKQSGNGREGGRYGIEEFLEYKSLQLKDSAV
ncbi:aldehyde dehydrogenase family protein [Candidimonas nitroreducens]|uniref:aldehyde dehydrogenase (NAD(+)) n=1 Tax=Candidimonas nitroreducens TaxID=683354 RepID=A0A225MYZ8_9BURK|nr:aldehyde dehydrogenase family protein [Candidimonas nitroreducens]OWT66455.1 aldehyde dehydrogenase family protein [Candidimonas nitroreducens]